ncbi:MAG TPA: alpha/beta hydrolase [Desulfobacteraceae bacterium]|nr:MAG: hypothetical protein B1H13_08630 [Desulfobacteraceae bacterium 4484_190.3]RLB16546.1 MAG: hypothetical protein DRG82_08855 [Deltaproteobacteria bacterium]HDZ24173.1 alpha/beta hydrolase [Desulfobacteraceae bacterium]
MSPTEFLKSRKVGFAEAPGGYREGLPTLVMIHGAGGCARMWQAQVRPLGKEINTLALDLPGHGDTPGPGMNTIASYADWLLDILQQLDIHWMFLMGHSMGGAIVQEVALRHQGILSGIILAATGPRLPVAPQFLEGLTKEFKGTVETIMNYGYAPDADPVLIGQGVQLMKQAGSTIVHDDFFACNGFDRKNDLSHIKLPCLIICGEQDRLTPSRLSESMRNAIPGAEFVLVPSAGHMVMIENFKVFNQTVQDFILKFLDK